MAVNDAYARASAMLDSVSWRGIKPGLERTRELLRALGNPETGLSGALVAGTNGKGSVCATVDAVVRAAGLRSVLLTKPHLHSYTERFVVDGAAVPDSRFGWLMDTVQSAAATLTPSLQPTPFEMLTAAGILLAAYERPDIVVCEVGLGGRLDSTNVLDLGVAVVTNVDLDHREFLGDTVPIIAREKAAIIKPGDDAVTGATMPALEEIRARCRETGVQLRVVADDIPVRGETRGLEGVHVDTVFAQAPVSVDAPLVGAVQIQNVATAIAVCDVLRTRGADIDGDAVRRGCSDVRWPGRMQWIARTPGWFIDGAHNPAGMAALVATVHELFNGRRLVVLFGVMRDKERDPMIASLRELGADAIVVTAASVDRAMPPDDLARQFEHAHVAQDIPTAMQRCRELAGRDGVIVACGSLYLVGDVLTELGAL